MGRPSDYLSRASFQAFIIPDHPQLILLTNKIQLYDRTVDLVAVNHHFYGLLREVPWWYFVKDQAREHGEEL